jgi:hypothetical protein
MNHFLCKITLFTWIISNDHVVQLFKHFALSAVYRQWAVCVSDA